MQKLLKFFHYNLQMAQKDIVSKWRLEMLMQAMPSLKEMKQVLCQGYLKKHGVSYAASN